ncbi:MAG: hypothetical protein IPK34_14665 [Ramlibacter sp.]|jgi:hypothetical protein|nr:hypothetical protein [Ramlibacter sp.]
MATGDHTRTPPLLFLDFDGVLHPMSGHATAGFVRAPALAEALEPFDCDVVVSSSWRFGYTPAQIRDRLPRTLGARMVDVTGNALFGAHARYREIQAWLRACRPAPGVAWRALDDSTWEFPARCPELIACDPNTGVTTRELDALVAWLNRLRG